MQSGSFGLPRWVAMLGSMIPVRSARTPKLSRGTWRSYLPYLAAMLVLTPALIVWTGVVVWYTPYDGGFLTSRSGEVYAVVRGEAAYVAGIRIGDRVVAVDGVRLEDLDGLYWGKGPGDKVVYSVERDGQTLDVSIMLASAPVMEKLSGFSLLAVACAFWLVSTIIWILKPFGYVFRRFFWSSQLTAATIALSLLAITRWPLVLVISDTASLLVPAMVLHLYALVPEPLPQRPQRVLVGLAYGVAVPLVAWTAVDVAVNGSLKTSGALLWAGGIYILATLLLAVCCLMWPREVTSEQARRRRRLLIAGMVGSILPVLLLSIFPQLFGIAFAPYQATVPFLILLPVSFAYAMYKGDLGRVDRLLNRSLVYVLTTGIVTLAGSLLGVLVLRWAGLFEWSLPMLGAVAIATATGALHSPVRDRVRCAIGERWYRGWPRYRPVVHQMSSELSRAQDAQSLAERLLEIARAMRFDSAVLLWREREYLAWLGSHGDRGHEIANWALAGDGALARLLTRDGKPVLGEVLSRELALSGQPLGGNERELIGRERQSVWVPLRGGGVLRGVLILGDRQGEYLLDDEDRDILSTLGEQGSMAAQNVALLDELREQLAQVEGARSEIAEAHHLRLQAVDEERALLALRLHDNPVQDLIGIRYTLERLHVALSRQMAFGELEAVEGVLGALEATTNQLRDIGAELRPAELNLGLRAAIRAHAESFEEKCLELELRLDLAADGQRLPMEYRAHLYYIYLEAVRNVQKHADATYASVRLEISDDEVMLDVCDDGDGFTVPEQWGVLVRDRHLGMVGMRDRAKAIGGCLEVESEPGEGTTIRVVAPVSHAGDSEWGRRAGFRSTRGGE